MSEGKGGERTPAELSAKLRDQATFFEQFTTRDDVSPDGKAKWREFVDNSNQAARAIEALVAERDAPSSTILIEGRQWKLVPVEPTEEMCRAGAKANDDADQEDRIWADMLAASPTPPQAVTDVGGGWQDISTAPRTRPIIVETERGRVFRAQWTVLGDDAVGWGTVNEDDPCPKCWTDGFCWASNEDEEESDKPIRWCELTRSPQPVGGGFTCLMDGKCIHCPCPQLCHERYGRTTGAGASLSDDVHVTQPE